MKHVYVHTTDISRYDSGTCHNGDRHPWDHAKWLLNRGGLLTEVGGELGLYNYLISGWTLGLALYCRLARRGWLLTQVPLDFGNCMAGI